MPDEQNRNEAEESPLSRARETFPPGGVTGTGEPGAGSVTGTPGRTRPDSDPEIGGDPDDDDVP